MFTEGVPGSYWAYASEVAANSAAAPNIAETTIGRVADIFDFILLVRRLVLVLIKPYALRGEGNIRAMNFELMVQLRLPNVRKINFR